MAKDLIWGHFRKITIYNIFIHLQNLLGIFEIPFTINTEGIEKSMISDYFLQALKT